MANSIYTYEGSRTERNLSVTDNEFLCNSLEVKRRYVYYRRGPFGTPNYECGQEEFKVKHDGLSWEVVSQCDNGAEIYRVSY